MNADITENNINSKSIAFFRDLVVKTFLDLFVEVKLVMRKLSIIYLYEGGGT